MFGTRRGIYQLGGGCPFKRIFTSAHLPGQNLGDIHFTSHSLCIFCFFSLAPWDLCRAFLLSVSLLLYPQELLVNLTRIPLLSLLSFSHMLLDWQGPALHALSFWLQAPPITTLCTHSYTHNAALLYGHGASANLFFFFSFSPLTAVVWVSPDKDSQKSWYQEGLLAIRTYILNSSPFH